jgi:hypothetical protein
MIGVTVRNIPTTATMAMIGGTMAGTNIVVVAIPPAIVVILITIAIGVIVTNIGAVDTNIAIGATIVGYVDGNIDDRSAMILPIR